ncbi:MAG: 16S rRNA (guanine(966)-N(2))-methyltransferase RsmD [Micropruina sp.]
MSRIIAGSHRGHRLTMPASRATRPTSDRVREAAFGLIASWLGVAGDAGSQLAGLAFLDLYAGSGAVGLEAASRGAARVVCVERDRRAGEIARSNAANLGLDVRVSTQDVERFLAGPAEGQFDVVWLDPPYDLDNSTIAEVLTSIIERSWLAPEGLLVVERSSRTAPFDWPPGLGEPWNRGYGETTLHFAPLGAP